MSSFNGYGYAKSIGYSSPQAQVMPIAENIGRELYIGFFKKIPLTYKNVSKLTGSPNSYAGKRLYRILINHGDAPQYMRDIILLTDKINDCTNTINSFRLNLSYKYGKRSPYAFVISGLTYSIRDFLDTTFGKNEIKKSQY